MKKTISLILCFAMILSTVAFAVPAFALDFEVEAAEDFAQVIETPVASLAADENTNVPGATEFKPGVNMLTGTEEAFGFEESYEGFTLGGSASYAEIPAGADNASQYGIKMAHTGENAINQNAMLTYDVFASFALTEAERPVIISYDWMGKFGTVHLVDATNQNLTSLMSRSAGGQASSDKFVHFEYAYTRKTKTQFVLQAVLAPNMASAPLYIDNLSIVPYYKVTFSDATGAVLGYKYVSPTKGEYTITANDVALLDADKYAGYKIQGADELVTKVSFTDSDIVLVPKTKEGVEEILPVSATGFGGKVVDVDPKYPGAYYVFDEPLDVDTITPDELEVLGADTFVYDDETNTLVLLSDKKQMVGNTDEFNAYESYVKTESGKYVVFPQMPVIEYATKVVSDGNNMIPYGDFETAYNPFYASDDTTSVDINVEDGVLYAVANTDEASSPYVGFQTVLEAGATYVVYAETSALEEDTAVPQIDIVFAGDAEGGLVNHESEDTHHVIDTNSTATKELVGDTWHYSAEFTVAALDDGAETAVAYAAIYTSPVGGKTVGFTIDNYELYKKTEVRYVPIHGVDAEDVDAPVDSLYLTLKGNVKNDEVSVTVADYVFPVVDNKRYVAGWKAETDGIIYEAGETIDLTEVELDESGNYVLAPYILTKGGNEFAAISFDGTGVSYAPENVEEVYLVGDVLPMAQFYTDEIVSTVPGKRFLGWSVDGTKAGMVQPENSIVLEGDVHFTAVVGYDFNFANKDSQNTLVWNAGSEEYKNNSLYTVTEPGRSKDVYFIGDINVPASEVHKFVLWFAEDYTMYSNADLEDPTPMKFSVGSMLGDGIYFIHDGQTASDGRKFLNVAAKYSATSEDGITYYGFEIDPTKHSSWEIDKMFASIRIDVFTAWVDLGLRYIEFVDYEEYDDEVIEITGLDIPKEGAEPDKTALAPSFAKIDSITWSPALTPAGLFKGATDYTASVVISPVDSLLRFNEKATYYISGYEAEVTSVDPYGRTTIAVTFPKTEDYKKFEFDLSSVPERLVVDSVEDIQFNVNVTEFEAGAVKDVTWSITGGKKYADITADGLLSVYDAGVITIKAVSNYNENKVCTKNVEIVLSDNVKPVEITFSSENVKKAPAAITRLAGDVLDLGEFLDVTSAVEGLNFNGWTFSGEEVLTGEFVVPNEDAITLYGVVNNDINFAVSSNVKGWTYNGRVTHENDMLMAYNSLNTNFDVRLEKISGYNVPASEYGKVRLYVTRYCGVGNSETRLEEGTLVEGLYFIKGVENETVEDNLVEGKVVAIEGDYAVIEFNLTSNSNWTGNIIGIRFDIGYGLWTYGVRYIDFVEKTAYEKSVIQITGIDAPVTGYDLDVTAKDAANLVEITSITWTPDEFIKYNYNGKEYVKFDALKTYTVTINAMIPLGSDKKFAEGTTATVNGEEATFEMNEDGTVTIVYTFPATEAYEEFSIEINGPETISKAGRTTQYRYVVDGDIPVDTVAWTIDPEFEGYAVINVDDGSLTPIKSIENLKIIATSHYNSAVKAEYYVTLENQYSDSTVYYDPNTVSNVVVEGMPEPTVGAGKIALSTDVPTKEGYIFVGWGETPDSRTPIQTVSAYGSDATVYAIWDKILYSLEFNDSTEDVTIGSGSMTTHPEYLELESNGNGDIRISTPEGINLDPRRSNKMYVRQSTSMASVGIDAFFYVPGQTDILGNMEPGYQQISPGINTMERVYANYTGLDDWQVHEIVFTDADWANSSYINKLSYDPLSGAGYTIYIDYIRFYDGCRDITFVANAGEDVVEGMPEDVMIKAGADFKTSAKPTREGYEFLGWSLSPDSGETVSQFTALYDDITLYAIWLKAVEVVDPTSVDLGAVTDEAVVVTTAPEATVTVTVTTEAGETELDAVADENGFAVIDLTGVEGEITAATVTAGSNITKVVLTDNEIADAYVESAGSTDAGGSGSSVTIRNDGYDASGSTGEKKYGYDTAVKPVKPTGSAVQTGEFGGIGETAVEEPESSETEEPVKAPFPVVNESAMTFEDVKSGDWFYGEVSSAYKYGFVEGQSEKAYNPQGNVTVAEVITLAVRLNYNYEGKELPAIAEGAEWYANYVYAAIRAGIIKNTQFVDYNAPATRREVAQIMYKALPATYMSNINTFTSIPDVATDDPAFMAIRKLYNAGVLTGMDGAHNFYPDNNVTRAEIAAVVNRMALPSNRKRIK